MVPSGLHIFNDVSVPSRGVRYLNAIEIVISADMIAFPSPRGE